MTASGAGGRSLGRVIREERGYMVASILRLILAFGLLGLAANEVGQMILAKVRVENAAAQAAQAGADAWASTHDVNRARVAAEAVLSSDEPDARLVRFEVTGPKAATVWAQETAGTLVIRRVSFLQHYGVQSAQQEEAHG